MEEMDVENVAHVSYPGHTIVYLRYDSSIENFDIFSDLDSKIEYEKTMVGYLLFAAIINLAVWVLNMTIFIINCRERYPSYISLACILNLILAVVILIDIIKRNRRIKSLTAERKIHE